MANPLYDALFGDRAHSGAPFLLLPGGTALTYADFAARAGRLAAALAAAGVAPGDGVAAQIDKSPDALALYAACLRAGAVLLPFNPAYTEAELAHFLADAAPRLFVSAPARADAVGATVRAAGARLATLGTDGAGSLADAAAEAPPLPPVARAPSDPAALLYTSGTTGRPKGAVMSQANLLANARTLTRLWGITAADRLIHALPVYHTHGLFVATNTLALAGGSMILLPRFETEAVIAAMAGATLLMGVPTFYARLLEAPGLARAAAGMRLFVSGSAPLSAETHRAFAARTGHAILERYGMTETGMIASNPLAGDRRAGTVGPALPDTALRIADPATGAALPAGATGRVEVRGPGVFSGYRDRAAATAAAFTADGFFVTGDLGHLDAAGYLTLAGRETDLIITGGLNVYPREVEEALDVLPGVRESAVIGVPDADMGEAVVAVVVPADHDAPPATEAVLAALADRLAHYKRPRRIVLADALPRSAMGKVDKVRLRRAHAPPVADT